MYIKFLGDVYIYIIIIIKSTQLIKADYIHVHNVQLFDVISDNFHTVEISTSRVNTYIDC